MGTAEPRLAALDHGQIDQAEPDHRESQREQHSRQQEPRAAGLQQRFLRTFLRDRAAGRGFEVPGTAGVLIEIWLGLHRTAPGLMLTRLAPPGSRTDGRIGVEGVDDGVALTAGLTVSVERNGI